MRGSGILLHITSLPSRYGIGTLGREAYAFVDFLKAAGQKFWQILPLTPTGFGDSPYQSFSAFAGNPYLIDLEMLCDDGLLNESECMLDWGNDPEKVNFGLLYANRAAVLKKAFERFEPNAEFEEFCGENEYWLDEYALFSAIKAREGGKPWYQWTNDLKFRNENALGKARLLLREEILRCKAEQFWFFSQWKKLHKYAAECGIKIIGDLPIYVAQDSADAWSQPQLFLLNEKGEPDLVAGVPPDGFNPLGQLWGNPVFDWNYLHSDGYGWWIRRTEHSVKMYDRLRIDHFRGFSSYYAVSGDKTDATQGEWYIGGGVELFKAIEAELGGVDIIAEDLGYIDDGVKALLEETGFPGMKILQFAFDSREDSDYLPHNYPKNCVAYIGTHDNDTLVGWLNTAAPEDVRFAKEYLRLNEREGISEGVIKSLLACPADTVILTMQDILGLGAWARMNTPSTLGGNWQWRMRDGAASPSLAAHLRELTALYRR